MYKFSLSFSLLSTALFVGTIADIYWKKLGTGNWPIEGKKKQYFALLCS